MNTLATLVRREYWEHRGLWIAPLIVSVVLILATLLTPSSGGHVQINGQELQFLSSMNADQRSAMFGVIVGGLMVPQMMVMLVVVFFYLSDALYGERKDRSILFWKSLPVSDASTVTSKLLVALGTTPLFVFFVSLITGLLCYAIIAVKYSGTPFSAMSSWSTLVLLRVIYTTFIDLLVGSLWYAPVAAFVLLVSGWAKRAVSLWVALPPLIIVIAEGWLLNTSRFAGFLQYRMFGVFSMMGIGDKKEIHLATGASSEGAGRITAMLDKLDLTQALLNIDVWLGVIAAAAMVLVAIRVRRYRDDTSG
jgi:ABC-2 type transport system permease protein